MAGSLDRAGRAIAGLIGYNPGPGIYSRLERAVEAMPENIRVQELPGLLKRYKEGVPGWELKATDLDSVIAGRAVVPREELLFAVRQRSPVYTHKEVVLGVGGPRKAWPGLNPASQEPGAIPVSDMPQPSAIGSTGSARHGQPVYPEYGQGGKDYTEILLTQPTTAGRDYGNHWANAPARGVDSAVAHARYDTHGDALRINELQSDLGIHNRKAREYADQNPQIHFGQRLNPPEAAGLPFPLEDAWADILIKRLALEAARKGHRAIEVASPRAIADKVGGNIENYEHFYGKVVPGAIERLGRKMGGLAEDASSGVAVQSASAGDVDAVRYAGRPEIRKTISELQAGDEYAGPGFWRLYGELMHKGLPPESSRRVYDYFGSSTSIARSENEIADDIYRYFSSLGHTPEAAQRITSSALFEAPRAGKLQANYAMQQDLRSAASALGANSTPPGRRYIMSDEMRRRLIEQGIGASLMAPMVQGTEE